MEPDSLVRVLMAMEARNQSTGAPTLRWYSPAAAAEAVMNAVLRVPPSFLAAALVSASGACSVSRRLRSDRRVHTVECAASVSESWLTTPRRVPRQRRAGGGDLRGIGQQVLELAADADRHPHAADAGRSTSSSILAANWRASPNFSKTLLFCLRLPATSAACQKHDRRRSYPDGWTCGHRPFQIPFL